MRKSYRNLSQYRFLIASLSHRKLYFQVSIVEGGFKIRQRTVRNGSVSLGRNYSDSCRIQKFTGVNGLRRRKRTTRYRCIRSIFWEIWCDHHCYRRYGLPTMGRIHCTMSLSFETLMRSNSSYVASSRTSRLSQREDGGRAESLFSWSVYRLSTLHNWSDSPTSLWEICTI